MNFDFQILIFVCFLKLCCSSANFEILKCKEQAICTLCDWTGWSECSRSCGGGIMTRYRHYNVPVTWGHEEITYNCNTSTGMVKETKVCGITCMNGGIFDLRTTKCLCSNNFEGPCCVNGKRTSPFRDKKEVSMFLETRNKRSRIKRFLDNDLEEECSEVQTCNYEEVLEYHSNWDRNAICNFFKGRKCRDCICRSGTYCDTLNDNGCSKLKTYEVYCKGCYRPMHCAEVTCTSGHNSICRKCEDQTDTIIYSIYWLTSPTKCDATCSWKENWCWPGECSTGLAKDCVCKPEFYKSSFLPAKCDLKKTPDLVTCRIGAESDKGRVVNSTSGKCFHKENIYMNFQAKYLSFSFTSEFSISSYALPMHIADFKTGLVGAEIKVAKKDVNDKESELKGEDLSVSSCDRVLSRVSPFQRTPVSCNRNLHGTAAWIINDGERICLRFVAKSGGFLVYQDFAKNNSTNQYYSPTSNSSQLCVYLDVSPPAHCSENKTCSEEPLKIANRISDVPEINIMTNGWFDPFPNNPEQASKIKALSLSVHETKEVDNLTLGMDEKSLTGMNYNISGSSLNVVLPSKKPGLYGLVLEVVDHAKNPRYARRFVMFDNSSRLLIRGDKKLKVDTGDVATNYTWQTHLRDVCLSWNGRYYNSFHVHYNLLKRIRPDHHGFYHGVYEQISGDLPVSGTPNVDGIVEFRYNWTNVRTMTTSGEKSIKRVTDQNFCDNLGISDGDSFVISITSVDIMKRTLKENIVLKVDSSVPDITDMWVLRNGVRQLFVHNSTELQNMVIEFSILDIHSGIFSIQWHLGTIPHGHELGMGAIAVQRLCESETSCLSTPNCYCPAIGPCEQHVYQINFNSLVNNNTHIGLHNREYFFTLKATNNAQLVSIERTDILVDNSPPEVGVVFEGVAIEKDIDYNSDATLFLNWHGFIDHESGIMKYRVGVDDHCMTSEELLHSNHNSSQISHLFETKENVIKVLLNDEGKYYATVIAYNNALQPSEPTCSDGIVYDTTPPLIDHVTVDNVHCREVIACFNNTVYLVMENLTAVELARSPACIDKCQKSPESDIVRFIHKIQSPTNSMFFSESVCQRLDILSEKWFIYLPSDKMVLHWNLTEDKSQTREVLIGLATNDMYSNVPDIHSFVQTRQLTTYSSLHNGIDRGIPIYILIKAVNKADLETVAVIGPVIIDETPPQYNGGLDVKMNDNHVFITWNNDSFSEMEQKEQFSNVLFRIGNEETYMTPFYQESVITSCPIDPSLHCIRYPLYKIQQLDNEKGVHFLAELSVFNIAGLHVRVRSPSFTVPSRFPPTNGVVLDIDPQNLKSNVDYDFLLRTEKVCASWFGFYHRNDVKFEIGIGTNPQTDDAIQFRFVNESTTCLQTQSLLPWQQYFSIIRAWSTVGSSISSSDGFVLITKNKSITDPEIFDGKQCHLSSTLEDVFNLVSSAFRTKVILNTEMIHTIFINESIRSSKLDIESNDVIWMKVKNHQRKMGTVFQFVPLLPNPIFMIKGILAPFNVSIVQCGRYGLFMSEITHYQSYWTLSDIMKQYVTHVFVAIVGRKNDTISDVCNSETITTSLNNVIFRNLNLVNQRRYRVKLSTCFDQICLPPSYSRGVSIDTTPPAVGSIHVTQTKDILNCTEIQIFMDPYKCSASGIAEGYSVRLETMDRAYSTSELIAFRNRMSMNSSAIKEKICISSPFLRHQSIRACIRGVCPSLSSATACVPILSASHPNEFDPNSVYAVKTSSINLHNIHEILSSTFLEDNLRTLQDKDVDFIKPDDEITGLLLNPEGRQIKWSIMTSPGIPTLTCEEDPACVQSVSSSNGVGRFRDVSFVENQKYFVCAYSDSVIIDKDYRTLKLQEISSCGNGFIVDNSAPEAGQVKIKANVYGFSNSRRMLALSWSGFADIEETVDIGKYENGIATFSYALGSFPGSEDIRSFINVGLRTELLVTNLFLPNGVQCYATVLAKDHVGNEIKSVSPGVTIDDTPPIKGRIWVGVPDGQLPVVSTSNIIIHWENFYDGESGIHHIDVGLGSSNISTDIVTIRDVSGTSVKVPDATLVDGHYYYAHINVRNYAGLFTTTVSKPFLIDSSPPHVGVVVDGKPSEKIDVDYQPDITSLSVHWYGFHDPHSGISYYEVGVRTEPGKADVVELTNVGLKIESTWYSLFEAGVKYYTSVRACNKVGLCSSATSDGVILDNSPPVPGLIHIGLSDKHQHYIPHRSTVSAKWVGFQDPHSGLSHFTWCLGTDRGLCDIEDFHNVHLSNAITDTGLNLPLNRDLYLTVTAFNNVGLNGTRTSDKFSVDVSPPVLRTKPYFIFDFYLSLRRNSQIDNSLLSLTWSFSDDQSPITEYSIFLHTHEKGHIEKQILTYGTRNCTTIQLDKDKLLKDGDTYTAWVVGCNAAGLCSESHTDPLLIDSTPPHRGGFKNMMLWKNKVVGNTTATELSLLWYGFNDVESNISHYSLSASKSFSGNELSNGNVDINHNVSLKYQRLPLLLSRTVSARENIVLSVSAVNKVGLRSKTGRITVTIAADDKSETSGFLEIQRHSCKTHYCNNDCTCAEIGQKCLISGPIKCKEDPNISVTDVSVHFGSASHHMTITPSKSCLIGHWNVSRTYKQRVLRFEWSIGIQGEKPGDGIFDSSKEDVWYDVGHYTNVTHCLPPSRHLLHAYTYILYVRTWISPAEYGVSKSRPILIDQTPPIVRRGKSVIEASRDCKNDIDYMNTTRDFYICWSHVFSEQQGKIVYYEVYGGSFYRGYDLLAPTNVGTKTTYKIDGTKLNPGTTYYFTVVATNNVKLSTSHTSDGILVDLDRPVTGVAFNTEHHKSVRHQPSVTKLGVSWHGFDDHQSFISHFSISIVNTLMNNHVVNMNEFGLQNSITLNDLNLTQGSKYKVEITAYDAAGHASDVAVSEEFIIDSSPPNGYRCGYFSDEFIQDPSFERKSLAHGFIEHTFFGAVKLSKGEQYKFIIKLSEAPNDDTIYLRMNDHEIALECARNSNGSGVTEYEFYGTRNGEYNITVSFMDRFNIERLHVFIQRCVNVTLDNQQAVNIKQISGDTLYIQTRIHDLESGVKSLRVGLGTTRNGLQIKPFISLPLNGIISVDLPHGSTIYGKVLAENYAGLSSIFNAPLVILDTTPPVISNTTVRLSYTDILTTENGTRLPVDDGNITPIDIVNKTMEMNTSTISKIDTEWIAEDAESGVLNCLCIYGASTYHAVNITSLRGKQKMSCSIADVLPSGTRVSTKVQCTNGIHMKSESMTSQVIVSYVKPDTRSASIHFIRNNRNIGPHDPMTQNLQWNNSMLYVYWDGFYDESEIDNYQARLAGTTWMTYQLRNFATIPIEGKGNGMHVVEVRTRNIGKIHSKTLNSTITVQSNAPFITGNSVIGIKKGSDELLINWDGVFKSHRNGRLIYQVSAGSHKGHIDIQRPIETMGTNLTLAVENDTKEIFLRIDAIAPNVEYSTYTAMIPV